MKWMLAVVTFGMLTSGRADADPKVPPELAKVQPPIEPTNITALTYLGKRKLGTREVLVWQEKVDANTDVCCDVPPGTGTFLYIADAATGKRMMEEHIGEMVGDREYVESDYRYRVAWSDLDNDHVPELVLTRTVLHGKVDDTYVPRELIWQLRGDQLVPISRAQLRCRPKSMTTEAADSALLAASQDDAFCAYSDARSIRGERLDAAQIVLPVANLCPTFAWWHRNDPDWIKDAVPITIYVLRNGVVYATSVTGPDVGVYDAEDERVVDLKMVRNGDRPFLAVETVEAGKHRLVVIDGTLRREDGTPVDPIVEEPLSPGERITVHDLTIAVGPAKGAARKHWTYDPAADAWQ